MMIYQEKELVVGLTVKNMLVSGKKTKCKVKVNLHGPIINIMKVIIFISYQITKKKKKIINTNKNRII